ncbi:PHB depolymerase family esterase [Methylobacterium sp. ap11]|uniref:extracellular catalytic domain type 1 short-chain-length polyhydroxyalkanoate depolymerase n=1 Tax=Methylobacterium sp. ap11 TaxID=1761799 RepID=UPI000B853089|nr:PHB depolymerase family esterase [Methylobacterium sp. ap11]
MNLAAVDMAEVTRLTRAGRLAEAMALLQGHAPAGPSPSPASAPRGAGTALEGAVDIKDAVDIKEAVDLEAPTEPGGAWTVPGDGPAQAAAAPSGLPEMPDTLRTLMRKAGQAGGLADLLRSGGLGAGMDAKPGADLGAALKAGLGASLGAGLGAGLGHGLGARRSVPVPPGARFEERRFAGPAGGLTYKVYVPSGRDGETLPVVVMLHGCTQDPDDFALGTRMNALAEEQGLIVVYPRQERAANAQKCWNWFEPRDQGRGAGEPALIAGIAREVVAEFGADPARVYVAGLSAGGAAAAILAAAYPDVFAAAGIHSGLACGAARDLPSALAAMGQGGAAPKRTGGSVPTIVFHGDGDRTVHPLNGERVAAQALPGPGLTETVTQGQSPGGIGWTRRVHADAAGREIVEKWVLHGAGHAWSGGSPDGSYTEPRGPDASAEMLRFFREHARAG